MAEADVADSAADDVPLILGSRIINRVGMVSTSIITELMVKD